MVNIVRGYLEHDERPTYLKPPSKDKNTPMKRKADEGGLALFYIPKGVSFIFWEEQLNLARNFVRVLLKKKTFDAIRADGLCDRFRALFLDHYELLSDVYTYQKARLKIMQNRHSMIVDCERLLLLDEKRIAQLKLVKKLPGVNDQEYEAIKHQYEQLDDKYLKQCRNLCRQREIEAVMRIRRVRQMPIGRVQALPDHPNDDHFDGTRSTSSHDRDAHGSSASTNLLRTELQARLLEYDRALKEVSKKNATDHEAQLPTLRILVAPNGSTLTLPAIHQRTQQSPHQSQHTYYIAPSCSPHESQTARHTDHSHTTRASLNQQHRVQALHHDRADSVQEREEPVHVILESIMLAHTEFDEVLAKSRRKKPRVDTKRVPWQLVRVVLKSDGTLHMYAKENWFYHYIKQLFRLILRRKLHDTRYCKKLLKMDFTDPDTALALPNELDGIFMATSRSKKSDEELPLDMTVHVDAFLFPSTKTRSRLWFASLSFFKHHKTTPSPAFIVYVPEYDLNVHVPATNIPDLDLRPWAPTKTTVVQICDLVKTELGKRPRIMAPWVENEGGWNCEQNGDVIGLNKGGSSSSSSFTATQDQEQGEEDESQTSTSVLNTSDGFKPAWRGPECGLIEWCIDENESLAGMEYFGLELSRAKHVDEKVNINQNTLYRPPSISGPLLLIPHKKSWLSPCETNRPTTYHVMTCKNLLLLIPNPATSSDVATRLPIITQTTIVDDTEEADMSGLIAATRYCIDLTNVDCIEIIEDGGRKRMSVKLENSHVWTLQTLSEVSLSYWIKNLLDLAAYWRARHIINMKTEQEITSTVKTPSPPQQEKSAIPVTAFKQRIKQFEMQVMQEQNYAYQLWPWCLYSGCYSIIKTGILFVKLQNQHIFMARHCVLTTTHFILLRPARRYKTWLRKHDTISIPLPSPSSDSHVFVMSGKGPVVDTWFKEIEEGKHVEHFSVFWYIGVECATQCGRTYFHCCDQTPSCSLKCTKVQQLINSLAAQIRQASASILRS
ncbi:hypothetical protein SeMB42_g02475 [Synchytrium endobioticum]|uniref:Uncharacterized protein n=1 Tax=Synchytrium endobioticum TaxID=286115 RepID=A0A507DG21_9FUNG|nr:hypothetical protein SeMB42_g02475 [Synchytrium endobioticum]